MYRSLHNKVPFEKIEPQVKSTLQEITGDQVAFRMPSKATVSRMVHELNVLAYIQATEALLSTDSATLAWDATTIAGGLHINEIHLHVSKEQTLTLSMTRLPGGRALDYVAHLNDVVDKMSNIYAAFTDQSPVAVKTSIVSHIMSTMSDRVATNQKVVRLLNQLWGVDLVMLHCNLHPLDGFANKVRTQLKVLDADLKIKNPGFGHDCCAANFLYSLSSLRYVIFDLFLILYFFQHN